MKPIISRLSEHSTLIFFPPLLLLKSKWKYYIFLFFVLVILVGCFRKFYNTGTSNTIDQAKIEQLKAANKYFIIHFSDSIRELSNITISNQVLNGKTGKLQTAHTKELKPETDKSNVFKNEYKNAVLAEVHLYVNKTAQTGYSEVQIPLSDIYRMDVYEFDKARTSTSTVLSVVGIATPIILGIIIAVAGSQSSLSPSVGCGCPQVYVEQKGNFDYQNGIFSGAVYANLERTDYLPLNNTQPENSAIHLRIAGDNDEIQYLNSTQLIGVYHKQGSGILADRHGNFYSINNPLTPEFAFSPDKLDLKETISKADGNSYSFNSYDPDEEYSKAFLTFKKPLENKKAKLIIRAKNSDWAYRVNQEYILLYGKEYSRYRRYWEHASENKMEKLLLKQGLPIKVYVENGDKWEYAGYFPISGGDAYRDMIMEINLTENKDENFRIKLETVYRFWDLDYAAIEFTTNESLNQIVINPVSVKHSTIGDQKKQLATKDKLYVDLKNGENIDLEFQVPLQKTNNPVSYFLASSGYYHIQKSYPVNANISRLKEFKKEGEFDRFSKEKYKELEYWQSIVKQVYNKIN